MPPTERRYMNAFVETVFSPTDYYWKVRLSTISFWKPTRKSTSR